MDRRWSALGAVCVEHAGNPAGRHKFAGTAGSETATETSEGNRHLPGQRGALLAMFWWVLLRYTVRK